MYESCPLTTSLLKITDLMIHIFVHINVNLHFQDTGCSYIHADPIRIKKHNMQLSPLPNN